MKQKAIIISCGDRVGQFEHSMRDNCYSCAPFWDLYPICPISKHKLSNSGFCKACKKYFDISNRDKATVQA